MKLQIKAAHFLKEHSCRLWLVTHLSVQQATSVFFATVYPAPRLLLPTKEILSQYLLKALMYK